MLKRPDVVLVLAAVFQLLAATEASAKVTRLTLAELVEKSDAIVLARVEAVRRPFLGLFGAKRAVARVSEVWKGTPGESVNFRAEPSWVCDISDAREGETVVLFLEKEKGGGWVIAHAGRGRMPVKTIEGKRHATLWTNDLRLREGTKTVDDPDSEHDFMRCLPLDSLKNLVQGPKAAK